MKICTGAWVLICRHTQTNRHSEAERHTVTTFHYIYIYIYICQKKILDLSWKCYQALFSVAEQLKSMPHLPNECSRENYTQLANLCNIKVKQEFEMIMLDIKITQVCILRAIKNFLHRFSCFQWFLMCWIQKWPSFSPIT